MKSRLLTTVFDDPDSENARTFARHLCEVLAMDDDQRQACLDILPQFEETRTVTQQRELISDLAAELDAPQAVLEHALSIIRFFSKALLSQGIPENDSELWGDDLQELGWIDDESRPAFDALLGRLTAERSKLRYRERERKTTGGVLPCFNSLGTTVEIRPIRKDFFHWGQSVEEYGPEILGTILVASVHIGVDEGPVEDFYFQADEEDIDNIIDSLRAAKKEMTAFRQFLRIDSMGKVRSND